MGGALRIYFFARDFSAAIRFSVRFFAAASDATLARAERSSGVEFRAAFLPPCLPNCRAISAMAARISAVTLTAIVSRIHLTGYGEKIVTISIDTVGGTVYSDLGSSVRLVKRIVH